MPPLAARAISTSMKLRADGSFAHDNERARAHTLIVTSDTRDALSSSSNGGGGNGGGGGNDDQFRVRTFLKRPQASVSASARASV